MTASSIPRLLMQRYRLDRLIAEGGMATVYLATDLKYGRQVALKMLRASMRSVLDTDRFSREIELTAQLDHPHIVPLLDSSDADGECFYIMPFVDGETLRSRLDREKQLPIEDALAITRQVLDALEYAHARGLIHRDIKPENILLAGGHARVTDFGIAKAIATIGGQRLTASGMSIGTPMYMSPEQCAADSTIDTRSDVYAVGCVLFEMLAGQPPFISATAENLVRQHMIAPPMPVTQLRPGVSPAVASAIDRALAKAPADRFASANNFAAALAGNSRPADTNAPVEPSPRQSGSGVRPRRLALVGLAVIAMIAAVVAAAVWGRRQSDNSARPLVAVLPFQNLGAEADQYFADGVTEEITARLARISGIGVKSRTTASRYRGTTLSLQQIARELGVQYVLEGTIRTERLADGTGQVRVTPDLVKVEDDTHLWTEVFTAGLVPGEIFTVQSRIAERVAEAFHVSLLPPEEKAVRQRETADSGAYRATLLGRFQLAKGTPVAVREAIGHFERAIAADARYARPWAGLANCYLRLPFFPDSWLSQAEAFAKAEDAARRAVALDGSSPEAHSALGEILAQGYWRWAEAEQEQRRALALDPDDGVARRRLSGLLAKLGQPAAALAEAERALTLEPTSPSAHIVMAERLESMGRYREAIVEVNEALRLEPSNPYPHINLAEIAAAQGDIVTMADELEKLSGMEQAGAAIRAWAITRGAKVDVIRQIAGIRSPNSALDYARKAWLFANIGEKTLALDALERSIEERSPGGVSLLRFPSLMKALSSEPRYRSLVERIGFRDAPVSGR